jgi:hypothetical protein
MASDIGLDRWIGDLRDRIERGELADIGPIDVGYGTGHFRGSTVIRIMLADLNHRDGLPPEAREWLDFSNRLSRLLNDFRRLRDVID